jgi:hypothetical protein
MRTKCPAVDVTAGPHGTPCLDPPVSRVWIRLGEVGALAWVALDLCPRHASTLVADAERFAPLEVLEPPGAGAVRLAAGR